MKSQNTKNPSTYKSDLKSVEILEKIVDQAEQKELENSDMGSKFKLMMDNLKIMYQNQIDRLEMKNQEFGRKTYNY